MNRSSLPVPFAPARRRKKRAPRPRSRVGRGVLSGSGLAGFGLARHSRRAGLMAYPVPSAARACGANMRYGHRAGLARPSGASGSFQDAQELGGRRKIRLGRSRGAPRAHRGSAKARRAAERPSPCTGRAPDKSGQTGHRGKPVGNRAQEDLSLALSGSTPRRRCGTGEGHSMPIGNLVKDCGPGALSSALRARAKVAGAKS